jgi:hypothetical protein
MRAMESGSHAPRDYIGVIKIESTFMRGADRLRLTEEPLELSNDFAAGFCQADVADIIYAAKRHFLGSD